MAVIDSFPPLQGAIAHAESWAAYLSACEEELDNSHGQETIARAESSIAIVIQLGELLPTTWNAVFQVLVRTPRTPWKSAKEFEALRQQVRALFFHIREAMHGARTVGEMLHAITGQASQGMERLTVLIENARGLEEAVFHDWPSFAEPAPVAGEPLPVEESLAEALGISPDEARQKMAIHRLQLKSTKE